MKIIEYCLDFLFNANKTLSSKALVLIFSVLAIFLIDNILGFSYYYDSDRKIDEVKKLNSIIADPQIDSTTRQFALNLRTEIITRENCINNSLNFFKGIKWSSPDPVPVIPQSIPIIEKVERNNFLFHLTAGGIYYLFGGIMVFVMIFIDKYSPLLQRIGSGIIVGIVLWMYGMFSSWLFDFIPQVSKSTWAWNYLINLGIQITLLVGFGLLYKQGKKRL